MKSPVGNENYRALLHTPNIMTTDFIHPAYDRNEYAPLQQLEAGDIDVWLDEREAILVKKAKDVALECEAAKLSTALLVGASFVMSANPLMWIPGAIGAAGYLYTLFQERQDTGAIKPIPLFRGSIGSILHFAEGNAMAQQHPYLEQIAYLSKAEQDEVLLIACRLEAISAMLRSAPPKVRFALYRYACRKFHMSEEMLTEDEVSSYVATAVSEARKVVPIAANPVIDRPVLKAETPKIELPTPAPQVKTETQTVTFEKQTPDLPALLAKSLKNSLIVGVPGAGKGIFVTNALEHVKRGDKAVTVFYIDPKNDPKETAYFDGRVDFLFRKDLMTCGADDAYEWIQDCLTEYEWYDAGAGLKLLIFDELPAVNGVLAQVKGALGWLTAKLTTYSSSGSSRGLIIWAIAQNAHTSGIGFDGGTRSIFIPVFLISADNISASEAILKAQMIPSDKRLDSDQIQSLCGKSEIGRAVFYGGTNQWYPAVKMTNFSGFDRDSRTFLPSYVATQPDEEGRESEVAESSPKVSDTLAEPLKTIWLWCKEQKEQGVSEVTVRDVMRKNFGVLKDKKASQIRQLLGILADKGFGEVEEEGLSHSAVIFRVY